MASVASERATVVRKIAIEYSKIEVLPSVLEIGHREELIIPYVQKLVGFYLVLSLVYCPFSPCLIQLKHSYSDLNNFGAAILFKSSGG
ncbi:hypothetical protein NIES2098_26430 [Calothrix sp. NIES-2098]|nr:hypothetical protein NIES2098_26430 [Calothrix sp. NIES-2098]